MSEFKREDLGGARFEELSLRGAVFHDVDLGGARFDVVNLQGATIRGALVADVSIDGEIRNLKVWGVDVVPLVDAELNRRHPGREKMRPADADGYREAWELLERLWGETVDRARKLPPAMLHESVDGEWSFIQTLRHLVFATDAWVRRAVLGDPAPWDPLDLPHDEMRDTPPVPRDRDVQPSLDEVLALRADRMATVRAVFAELTDERLTEMTEPVPEPGYPESQSYQVSDCLGCILSEEWEHRMYAERDLAVLESGKSQN
ncbi:DinB family protein [Kribbella sp. NPDC049174]|uniref:DinB family protein n=1 Tax=Kribbella sp. NPDC049174 TaxID=3364112 RepID=UPI00372016E9